jgi:hypothetical protein
MAEEFVNILVPKSRVLEVYRLLGQSGSANGVAPSESSPPGERKYGRDLIERAYRESPESMKRFFNFLADNAGREVSSEQIARAIGRTRPQLAGVLGAFGRRWKRRYRNPGPWPLTASWNGDVGMWLYVMTTEDAEVIIEMRGR